MHMDKLLMSDRVRSSFAECQVHSSDVHKRISPPPRSFMSYDQLSGLQEPFASFNFKRINKVF